jgi:hypothetical protein
MLGIRMDPCNRGISQVSAIAPEFLKKNIEIKKCII